jgi:hypothetical protein
VANGEPAKFRVATVRQSDAKEELRAEPITGDIKHDTVATLTVNPTPVPDYHFGLSAIWLAVYGGSYYRSHAQEATDPVFPVGESYAAGLTVLHQGVNVSSKSKVQQIEPFFLIELTEFQPDKLIRLQGNRLIRQGWPKDFKGKVVNAEYKVLSWMDVAGHQIPQTFQAQKYLPNIAAGSGGALSLVTRFTGTITNAQFISTNVSSGIDVPAPTRIIENRLPVPGFVYISPDGRLRNLKEVSALDDYKRRLRSFQPSIASRTRIFIYIVLLAAAVFPIILWKKQTRSARPTGNNK